MPSGKVLFADVHHSARSQMAEVNPRRFDFSITGIYNASG